MARHSTLETVACAVCGGQDTRPRYTLEDRWCNPPRHTWTVAECHRCTFLFVNPRPPAQDLGMFYPADYYDPVTPHDDWWVRHLTCDRAALVEQWHPAAGRFLEVGFGNGDVLLALHRRGWEVWGVDPSAAAIRQATAKLGTTERLQHADVFTAQLPSAYFDAIVLWHSIEHVPDPRPVLAALAGCLRAGGYLVMATPNAGTLQRRWFGRAWSAWRGMGAPPRHLSFFTPGTLAQLTQTVGLEVLAVNQRADALANLIAFKGSLLAWLGAVDADAHSQITPPSRTGPRRRSQQGRRLLQAAFRSGCWLISTGLAWCGSGDTMVLVSRRGAR